MKLERFAHHVFPPFAGIGGFLLFQIRCTRWVLNKLLKLGHRISSLQRRHMEYDADQFQAQIIGSNSLKECLLKLEHITYGRRMAIHFVQNFLLQNATPNNIPMVDAYFTSVLTDEQIKEINHDHMSALPDPYSFHPSTSQRHESVNAKTHDGIFNCTTPAQHLFNDFTKLCKEVTALNIQSLLAELESKPEHDQYNIISANHLIHLEQSIEQNRIDMQAYLGECHYYLHPLKLEGAIDEPIDQTIDIDQTLKELDDQIKALLESESYTNLYRNQQSAYKQQLNIVQSFLISGHAPVNPDPDGVPCQTGRYALFLRQANNMTRQTTDLIRPVHHLQSQRIMLSLRCLFMHTDQETPDLHDMRKHINHIFSTYKTLVDINDDLLELGLMLVDLNIFEHNYAKNKKSQPYVNRLLHSSNITTAILGRIQDVLKTLTNPFALDDNTKSLDKRILPKVPSPNQPGVVLAVANESIRRILILRERCLAKLVSQIHQSDA
jgi:hypothetical protein